MNAAGRQRPRDIRGMKSNRPARQYSAASEMPGRSGDARSRNEWASSGRMRSITLEVGLIPVGQPSQGPKAIKCNSNVLILEELPLPIAPGTDALSNFFEARCWFSVVDS